MTRSERLLSLIQMLRRQRQPVQGHQLADKLGVSLRTIYRDIASLQAQGAPVEGEAGVGYVLMPGFMLPPLMFTIEEMDAVALGVKWVAGRGDAELGEAARNALAKIEAVVPGQIKDGVQDGRVLIPPAEVEQDKINAALIREAIRKEHKLHILYRDGNAQNSERIIWPLSIAFFEQVRIVIAWCERRDDFRHFRTDRIERIDAVAERYPRRRFDLIRQWREKELASPPPVCC